LNSPTFTENAMTPAHPNPPISPGPLSEQERQELEAAEKGFDPAASALPDLDEARGGLADQRAKTPRIPESERAPAHHKHPVNDARNKGMLPGPNVSGPPIDAPNEED
jgi:hypothetical protein